MEKSVPLSVDMEEALNKAISNINGLELTVLYLKIYQGFTLKEISKKLAISHESIRLYLKHISDKVKDDGQII